MNQSKPWTVDDIIQTTVDEEYNLDMNNINIDDILNEYNGSGVETNYPRLGNNTRFGFTSSVETSSNKGKTSIQDDDINKMMEDADHIYRNDLNSNEDNLNINLNLNLNFNNYLENINVMDMNHEMDQKNSRTQSEEILPYKNSIEFINYMETVYIKSKLEGNENVFQLRNYKQHAKIKFVVLDFIKKTTLSTRFFRGNNLITSIAAQDDVIFAGNNLGIVRMYSCEKEYEFKSYCTKEIEVCEKRSVVCMDISADGDFLISGYSNGYLALWDLHSTKCKKLITNVHKSCIVACKFIRNDKKKFELLSSDADGNVFKIIIKEGFLSTSVDSFFLIRHDIPIFLINILKIEDDDKKFFPEFVKTQSLIVAFGCLDYIMVFMLEPESKRLFKFEKPKYFKDNYVPDINFGIGYVPNIVETEYMESILDQTGNQSYIQGQSNIDNSRPQIILAISWGKIIYLYCLPVSNGVMYGFTCAGHYINTSAIIRMGFLSNSIIFFFDKQKFVKVINSSLITPGEVRISADYEMPIPYFDSSRKPELEEGRIVDPDISFQTYVIDKAENTTKATYNNFILNLPKNIYVLAKKDFYHGRLLNWEQCLNNLQQNAEWMDALTLGLDIYLGKTTALADIPIEENIRKIKVGSVLKNLIHQYVIIHMGSDRGNILSADKTFQDRLNKCINICIEFCIEIDGIEFLLNSLQPIFDSKGYGDEFIQKLEPFILCDKIINQQLQQMTVSKIIDLYIKNKKFHVLSQILIHLDIQSIDIEYVKYICDQYNLFSPLIYVYSNGADEDYFHPIKKMFDCLEKAKEIKPYVSYSECLKNYSIAELETSKQYIGHKLIWYINLCLQGKKIPSSKIANIPETKFKKLVIKIIFWILSEDILTKLLLFDSSSIFLILTKIFEDDKIKNIIESKEFDSYNTPSEMGDMIDLKPITIINLIIAKCKEINKNQILHDMYEFLARISVVKGINLNRPLIIEAGRFLLSFPNRDEKMTLSRGNVSMFTKYIETISNLLIDMIDARKDLEEKDVATLLSESNSSPYVMVKIHLLKMSRKYESCLEVFLQRDNHIKDRELQVFQWIDETFRELEDDNVLSFESLKKEVLNKLPMLADISIPNVTILVEDWYKNEQDEVIHKLDKFENLQLKYVESVIEKFKDEMDFTAGFNDKKEKQAMDLLNLHIKLLCELFPTQVLPNLKKRKYPVEECLKECLKHKIFDAAIFLYQANNEIREALDLALEVLNSTFNKILANLSSSNFSDNTNTLLSEDLKSNLKKCVDICENNPDRLEGKEGEEIWFLILTNLYNMIAVFKDKSNLNEVRKNHFEDLNKKLSQEMKKILEKMCAYVNIDRIIFKVIDNYKQAEFKEFKEVLLKMLSSYSDLKNILISAKNLLANSILYNVIELKKLNQKGNKYNLGKCDQCGKKFNNVIIDETILLFGCGHKCHVNCALNLGGEKICNICSKNEIENSVTNPNIRSLIQSRVHKIYKIK